MSDERPETCPDCGAPVVWCTCNDPYPTAEQADKILRDAGCDPEAVALRGKAFTDLCKQILKLQGELEKMTSDRDSESRWASQYQKELEAFRFANRMLFDGFNLREEENARLRGERDAARSHLSVCHNKLERVKSQAIFIRDHSSTSHHLTDAGKAIIAIVEEGR